MKTRSNRFKNRTLSTSAVALGALAAVDTASAEVIFSGTIDHTVAYGATYDVDVDNNGTAEFKFDYHFDGGDKQKVFDVDSLIAGAQVITSGGAVVQHVGPVDIDSGFTFTDASNARIWNDFVGSGQWADGETGYMGFQFDIGGSNHYGWLELATSPSTGMTITSLAYDDAANTAITTGDVGGVTIPEPGFGAGTLLLGTLLIVGMNKRFRRNAAAQ